MNKHILPECKPDVKKGEKGTPQFFHCDRDADDLSIDFLRASLQLVGRRKNVILIGTRGRSMFPLILPREHLAISVGENRPRPGQIWAFVRGNRIIVHRAIAVRAEGGEEVFLEMGDHAFSWGMFRPADCVGQVIAIKREKGWLPLDDAVAYGFGRLRASLDRGLCRLGIVGETESPSQTCVLVRLLRRVSIYALMMLSGLERLLAYLRKRKRARVT